MTPEIWQRAQQLFHDALELSEANREAWLQDACAGDEDMFALVLELMATDAAVTEQSIVPGIEVLQNAEKPELQIGQILGSYQITAFIGSGGMGQVFRAERTDGVVKQVVAIKLLRFSASAAELKRRFAIERRILARLNHPGIARFLDAGADQSERPFVVMELIDGLPITAYARQHRLGLQARLQLFVKVLDAVSYAHSQLIVHRDIKPGNVLVDKTGAPRLLDFGIAKPLSDIDEALRAEGATETTMRAFSLKYAAPEQFKGEAIGIGCDIYGLGGLLYELLTDCTALELHDLSMLKAQERVFHQMPALPSERHLSSEIPYSAKVLRGDLDRITLHALKKEPQERYATVEAFGADVRRYLKQEPISLRSGIRRYRISKFLQRNKLPVALASVLAVALFLGGSLMWLQQRQLTIERDNALRAQRRAERSSDLFLQAFKAADPTRSFGRRLSAIDILTQGEALALKQFADDPNALLQLKIDLAHIWNNLGENENSSNLIASTDALKITDANVRNNFYFLAASNLTKLGKRQEAIDILRKLYN